MYCPKCLSRNIEEIDCPDCDGSGFSDFDVECEYCEGTGKYFDHYECLDCSHKWDYE